MSIIILEKKLQFTENRLITGFPVLLCQPLVLNSLSFYYDETCYAFYTRPSPYVLLFFVFFSKIDTPPLLPPHLCGPDLQNYEIGSSDFKPSLSR